MNRARERAFNWLVAERIHPSAGAIRAGGWDESNTARILTGLQLVDNGWIFDAATVDGPLAVKQMNSEILEGLVRWAVDLERGLHSGTCTEICIIRSNLHITGVQT